MAARFVNVRRSILSGGTPLLVSEGPRVLGVIHGPGTRRTSKKTSIVTSDFQPREGLYALFLHLF
jgi:hypothetical protein